jgi:hypothetical protein
MTACTLPELAEADFLCQVFNVTTGDSAAVLDNLLTKAAGLGLSAARPSSTSGTDKYLAYSASGADSNTLAETSHARTASTESKCSVTTTLKSTSTSDYPCDPAPIALSRKRSRNLVFAQYDKLLAQAYPKFDQPKLSSLPPLDERHSSAPSLFSVSTRKSYLGIRNGILRIRRRRKSSPFPEALLK